MKFICDKQILLNAIMIVSRAVAVKSPMTALEGILMEVRSNSLKLTGYDMKRGIYTVIDAEVQEPGSVILGARIFGEIVRNLPDGDVTISSNSELKVRISAYKSEYDIIGSNPEDFPELPEVSSSQGAVLPQSLLGSMIRETIFAVSDSEARPVYTGELLQIENNSLTIVACDGFRLSMRKENLEKQNEDCSFIVPERSLSDLEKLCGDSDEDVGIVLGDKHISFTVGKTVLISRRLDGDFLDYRNTVPKEFAVQFKVDKDIFQRTLERVALIIDDRVKNPVRCIFGDGEVKMNCQTALGRADDLCAVDGNGNDIEMAFNNRYLLDAFKAAPDDEVIMGINSSFTPCVLSPVDHSDRFLYMILPVRFRN